MPKHVSQMVRATEEGTLGWVLAYRESVVFLVAVEAPLNPAGICDVVRGIALSASLMLVCVSQSEGLTTEVDVAGNASLKLDHVVPGPIFNRRHSWVVAFSHSNDVPVLSQLLGNSIVGQLIGYRKNDNVGNRVHMIENFQLFPLQLNISNC